MMTLAFKNFLRSRSVLTGLLLLLSTGLISLLIGRQFLDRQQQHITDVTAWQQEHIRRHAGSIEETGLLLYYLRFTLANKTTPLNGLSIGQKDIQPSVKSLTIRNLEAQQYDTDLYNPANLLLGNLDYSFVLIYLFPLVIIAFTYNTLSGEKEKGTWPLLVIQSGNARRLLVKLFALRCATVMAILLVLLLAAAAFLSIPFNTAFIAVIGLSLLYLFFWFALSFWVVSWQKNSAVNALSLLSLWILFTIIAPAALNNYLMNRYPLPEALDTALEQRRGYHEKWDTDQQGTMDRFFAHYPQFKKYPLPADGQFSWLWYYAMQQMGDDEARHTSQALKNKLHARESVAGRIASFIPTLHAQWQMDHLAQSGLGNHLQFMDSAARFHERRRLYWYPKIFENTPPREENWNNYAVEYFSVSPSIHWIRMFLPVILCTLLLWLLSAFHLKNIHR